MAESVIFVDRLAESHQSRLGEMLAVGEEQKIQSSAPRDLYLARLLSIATAYRLSHDLGVGVKVIAWAYLRMREASYHLTELEPGKLKWQIKLNEAYFGSKRNRNRGRAATGKSVVFGVLRETDVSNPKSRNRWVLRN